MDVIPQRVRAEHEHRWADRRLRKYVDDELNLAQRERLERHADICPECGPLLRALTVTVFRLRQLRVRHLPPVAPKVIERLRAEDARR